MLGSMKRIDKRILFCSCHQPGVKEYMVVVSAGAPTVEQSAIRDWFCLHFWSFDELYNKPSMKIGGQEYILGTLPGSMKSF